MEKLQVTITGELPADEFDKADVMSKVRAPLAAFVTALGEAHLAMRIETKVFTAKTSKADKKPRVVKPAAE